MLNNKRTISLIVGIVVIASSVVLYKNNKVYQETKRELQQLVNKAESLREELIAESHKRSLVQQKVLNNSKELVDSLKLIIKKLDQIEFKNQNDFNTYEALQNEIQQVITKNPSKNKNKKNHQEIQRLISELEWADKTFNEVRLKFSEAEISRSKIENRNPVTFISDIQLIQTNKH